MSITIHVAGKQYFLNEHLAKCEYFQYCVERNTNHSNIEIKIDDDHYEVFKMIYNNDFAYLYKILSESMHYVRERQYKLFEEKIKTIESIHNSLCYFGSIELNKLYKKIVKLFLSIQSNIFIYEIFYVSDHRQKKSMINRQSTYGQKDALHKCNWDTRKRFYSCAFKYHEYDYEGCHCFFLWYEHYGKDNELSNQAIFTFDKAWKKHINSVICELKTIKN